MRRLTNKNPRVATVPKLAVVVVLDLLDHQDQMVEMDSRGWTGSLAVMESLVKMQALVESSIPQSFALTVQMAHRVHLDLQVRKVRLGLPESPV